MTKYIKSILILFIVLYIAETTLSQAQSVDEKINTSKELLSDKLATFKIINTNEFDHSEIITSGIPLAESSHISDTKDLRVVSSQDEIIPTLFTPTAYWPRKVGHKPSIKWLLMRIDASVIKRSNKSFCLCKLKTSVNLPDKLPNLAKQLPTGELLISPGKYQFKIDVFGNITTFINRDGNESEPFAKENSLRVQGIKVSHHTAKIKIIENNQFMTHIFIEREIVDKPMCRLSNIRNIYFYRDKNYIQEFNSLRNYEASYEVNPAIDVRKTCEVENLDFAWKLNLEKNKSLILGTEGSPYVGKLDHKNDSVKIYQDSSGNNTWKVPGGPYSFKGYRVYSNNSIVANGDHAGGWIDFSDHKNGMTVAIRYFWQNNPKKLQGNGDGGLIISLWPEEFSIPHWIFGGYQKTTELFYYFHSGDAVSAHSKDIAAAFMQPLFAQASPEYYLATGAFYKTAVANKSRFEDYERLIDAQIYPDKGDRFSSVYLNNLEKLNVFGNDFFGDTDQETDRWTWTTRQMSNLEQDPTWGMILAFARKGDLKFLDAAIPMARHSYDIDINHSVQGKDFDKKYGGANRKHGSYHIDNGAELTHVWLQGILNYYFLTGDELAFSGAREIADNIVYRVVSDRDAARTEARIPGWSIKALTQFYLATGERKYLDAALLMKDKVMNGMHPSGYYDNTKNSVNPWMHGILVEALYDLWLATGKDDIKLKNAIIRITSWLKNSAWNETYATFPLGWIPKSGGYHFSNNDDTVNCLIIVDSMVIGYWLTGDKNYMDVADKAFETGTHYPWGKAYIGFSDAKIFAKQMNFGHRYLFEKQQQSMQ